MNRYINIDDEGYIYISRCDYLYRDGECNKKDERRMGDGCIIGRINPEAYKDIRDAKEIVNWIDTQLEKVTGVSEITNESDT
jgi:hypothetical protein